MLYGFLPIFVAGCAEYTDVYNPLAEFEEVHIATIFAMPDAQPSANYSPEQLQRGRYMVRLWQLPEHNRGQTTFLQRLLL